MRVAEASGSRAKNAMSVDFFDSNVILYSLDAEAPTAKQSTSRALIGEALAKQSAVISWQVVQETLHVISRKFKTAVSPADRAQLLARVLVPLWQVQPSPILYGSALKLQQDYGFGFYDSLIVAAARDAGCERLLTEGLQHGQRVGDLQIENPFRSSG